MILPKLHSFIISLDQF